VLLRFHTGQDRSVLIGFLGKNRAFDGFGFLTITKSSCGHLVMTRMPAAKCKLHGWSSDDALLMRRGGGRERTDKTG